MTLQVRPASISRSRLMGPAILLTVSRSSNLYMWETMAKFTREELSHRQTTISSLAFGLAEHSNEVLVRGCSHTGPVRHGMNVGKTTFDVHALDRQLERSQPDGKDSPNLTSFTACNMWAMAHVTQVVPIAMHFPSNRNTRLLL